jgi:hypothetical protein
MAPSTLTFWDEDPVMYLQQAKMEEAKGAITSHHHHDS